MFELAPTPARPQRWEVAGLLLLLLVAALVRFWGVGDFGLHKPDEDTTVLAAMHIFQDGTPRFPSGMLYTRAMLQSYLIAGAVALFGETEWSLRLPSVLCGVFVVAVAWRLGRRFLNPVWNMAFVAVVALLPSLIADSQEARMYIFLVAALAAYAVLIFDWERTGRTGILLAATAVMLLAIQIQQLAIFGSLLIFFPGLVRGDLAKLLKASLALVPIGLYFVYVRWTPSPYPPVATDYAPAISLLGQVPTALGLRFQPAIAAAAGLAGVVVAWLFARRVTSRGVALTVAALLWCGLLALAGLYYHLGLLLLAAGVLLAWRNGGASWPSLLLLLALVGVMALLQYLQLHAAGAGSLRKIFGVMVGRPSVWPYFITISYSPVAIAAIVAGLALTAVRVARRQPIPDYWLFFLLAVWLPLFGMGMTGWYFPSRYAEFSLLPMIVTALAVCQGLPVSSGRLASAVAAALCAVAIVNPVASARAIDAGDTFPDHKAAATFMRSVQLGPKDVVLAEEVLMQTYYLGRVDYWLVSRNVAAIFMQRVGDRILDQYTHTPVIGTGEELRALLERPDRGAIFVIGSGEAQEDGRRFMRGDAISALLAAEPFKVVFEARDGLTKVWKVDPPGAPSARQAD
jgi:hypothetical protein